MLYWRHPAMGASCRRRHPLRVWLPRTTAAALLLLLGAGAGSGEAAEIRSAKVTFQRRDGRTITAFLLRPAESRRHPAVLIFHGAPGVGESHKAHARRLAGAGFVALLPDLASIKPGANESAGLIRSEIAAAISAGLMLRVSSSTSTNFRVSPAARMQFADAVNASAGVITSSPRTAPRSRRVDIATMPASVPELVAIA